MKMMAKPMLKEMVQKVHQETDEQVMLCALHRQHVVSVTGCVQVPVQMADPAGHSGKGQHGGLRGT